MWEITLLAPVEERYLQVCEDDPETAENILEALDLPAEEGPTLGRPAVDRIHRSRLHNLKELREGRYADYVEEQRNGARR
ncbi:hypothetical protein ABTY61_24060 [Kitasatospora sp. NPDC096128]|uniref:hypothetical protein n=1 Tax=Kitasatospora sp. NPDC096128 TaxID=3155547 RepID=UPI003333C4EE